MTEYLHRDPTRRDTLLTIEEVVECIRIPVASLRYWRRDVLDWLDEQRESTGRGVA